MCVAVALHCSLVDTVGNSKLVTYKGLKMSFSKAPLKRFNESVGKQHSTAVASSIAPPKLFNSR